jgi:hypothetical protein
VAGRATSLTPSWVTSPSAVYSLWVSIPFFALGLQSGAFAQTSHIFSLTGQVESWYALMKLFTQGIWQPAVVAKTLESLSVFHANALARHLFHFIQLGFGRVWLVVVPAGSWLVYLAPAFTFFSTKSLMSTVMFSSSWS